MKHTTIKAAPKKAAAAGGKGAAHRMTIEKAKNGFTVRTHRKSPDAAKANARMGYMPEPEPDEHVFNTPEEMGAHVMSQFGGSAPAAAGKKASDGDGDE